MQLFIYLFYFYQTVWDRKTLWKRTGRILWLSSSHGKEPWYLPSLSIIITLDSCQEASHAKVWLTLIWWGWWTITNQQTIREMLTHKILRFLREEVWEGQAKDVRELRISGSSEAAFWCFYLSNISAVIIDLDAFIFLQHSKCELYIIC